MPDRTDWLLLICFVVFTTAAVCLLSDMTGTAGGF